MTNLVQDWHKVNQRMRLIGQAQSLAEVYLTDPSLQGRRQGRYFHLPNTKLILRERGGKGEGDGDGED